MIEKLSMTVASAKPAIFGCWLAGLFLWGLGALVCNTRIERIWSPRLERMVTAPDQTIRWRSEGWANTHVGKEGIVEIIDEAAFGKPSILLWGDSYVEALQVADEDKMAQVATRMLRENGSDARIFGIASSGQMIADYILEMPAYERLFSDIETHVIFLAGVEDMLPDQATQDRARFVSRPEPALLPDPRSGGDAAESARSRWVNDLRLNVVSRARRKIRDGFSDLRFRPGPVRTETGEPASDVGENPPALTDFRYIAQRLRGSTSKPIIVIYCPVLPFIKDGHVVTDDPDAAIASNCARALANVGIRMIDLSGKLRSSFLKDHVMARGFPNTYPGKGHLNPFGHRMVAGAVVDALMAEDDVIHSN